MKIESLDLEKCIHLIDAKKALGLESEGLVVGCDHADCSVQVKWKKTSKHPSPVIGTESTDRRFSYCGNLVADREKIKKLLRRKTHKLEGTIRESNIRDLDANEKILIELGILEDVKRI